MGIEPIAPSQGSINQPTVQVFIVDETAVSAAPHSAAHTQTHTHKMRKPKHLTKRVWSIGLFLLLKFHLPSVKNRGCRAHMYIEVYMPFKNLLLNC